MLDDTVPFISVPKVWCFIYLLCHCKYVTVLGKGQNYLCSDHMVINVYGILLLQNTSSRSIYGNNICSHNENIYT